MLRSYQCEAPAYKGTAGCLTSGTEKGTMTPVPAAPVAFHETPARTPWVPYTGIHVGSLIGVPADELPRSADLLTRALLEAHRLRPAVGGQGAAEREHAPVRHGQRSPPTAARAR